MMDSHAPESSTTTLTTNAVNNPPLALHSPLSPPPLRRLDEEIDNLVSALNNHVQTNQRNEIILTGDAIHFILDETRLRTLASAFYQQAEDDSHLSLQRSGRILRCIQEFIEFALDGNLKTLAALLWSGCGYNGLWLLDNKAQALAIKLANIKRSQTHQQLRFDDSLPLARDEAIILFGSQLGSNFHENQYIFIPVHLHRGEHFDRQDMKLRLPILSRELIGVGASSDVYEIAIARRAWVEAPGHSNEQPYYIVQKIYRNGRKEEQADQRKHEYSILGRERQSSTHSDLIVPCLGSLDDGDELSLLFPKADWSLEKLFNLEIRHKIPLKQLLLSLAALGQALQFLHDGGFSRDGEKYPVYHRDFRPANVFIFNMFEFKVADFGMSRILGCGTDNSPRDIRPSPENAGTYSAPPTIVGVGRDVWGFIAMTIVAITFKVGGPPLVEEFLVARTNRPDKRDGFWVRNEHGAIEINPLVVNWIELELKRKIEEEYGTVLSNHLHKLLDFLVFDCFGSLISSHQSGASNQSKSPAATNIMDRLRRTAAEMPSVDPSRPPTPESSSGPSSLHRSTVVEPAYSDPTVLASEPPDLPLDMNLLPAEGRLIPDSAVLFDLRSRASDTATTPHPNPGSSIVADDSDPMKNPAMEVTPHTSIQRSERPSFAIQREKQGPSDDRISISSSSSQHYFWSQPMPHDELIRGVGGALEINRPTSHTSADAHSFTMVPPKFSQHDERVLVAK